MFKINNKISVTLIFILFLFTIGTSFWFFYGNEKEDFETLSRHREQVHEHLSFSLRTTVAPQYRDSMEACEEMGQYDQFTSSKPSDLSVEELERALALYEKCGTHFSDRRMFSYQKMSEKMEEMEEELFSIESIDESLEEDFLEAWDLIDKSVLTLAETFEDLSNIQNSYWEAEYSYRIDEITSEEREDRFGELNSTAQKSLDLMSTETEKLKELKVGEKEVWDRLIK